MSAKELNLVDGHGNKLYFRIHAGQILVTPIVEKVGDTISLNRGQAHLLKLYLEEHLE